MVTLPVRCGVMLHHINNAHKIHRKTNVLSRMGWIVSGLLALTLSGCGGNGEGDTVARPIQDLTPPNTLWLQADIAGRPLGNVYLAQPDSTMQTGDAGTLVLKVNGQDNDGGVKAVRIYTSYKRSTASTLQGPTLVGQPIVQATSNVPVGAPAPRSLYASASVDTAALLGSFNDLELKAWAEVENYNGSIGRTGILTIPIRQVKLRLRAIALSNKDGTKASNVTADGFSAMVQRLNRRFEDTMIRFVFNPATDFESRPNTDLNTDTTNQLSLANQLALDDPQRIPVLLRFGPDQVQTGNGNAYPPSDTTPFPAHWPKIEQNYVSMPGWLDLNSPIFLNLGSGNQLAHDFGHFLGLFHTFPGPATETVYGDPVSSTLAAASDRIILFYESNGGTLRAFDGDGLGDTPPDPNPRIYELSGVDACRNNTLTVTGKNNQNQPIMLSFTADTENVMSYFRTCFREPDGSDSPQHFTRQQIGIMHRALRSTQRISLLR